MWVFFMNKQLEQRGSYYEYHSDRVILVRIKMKWTLKTIVWVYIPISMVDVEAIENNYEEMENSYNMQKTIFHQSIPK